nr:NAD(P)/FAD-dependent oxidoreductase [Prevotella sp.]
MNKRSAIIIGGGLGGLFTGAILSKEGLDVTVIEKNTTIGGGLQSFNRFGKSFDTGMHVIGGMQEGGNIRQLCNYLGILDKIEIKDVDADCTDKLYFAEDNHFYTIAKGKDNYIKTLAKQFPGEEDDLRNYVNAIYNIADSTDLFNLRPSHSFISAYPESFTLSANEFIAKYIKDEKLRSVIAYMNPLYGGKENQTPAFIHAIINVLYINGTSRFIGSSQKFANLLADIIKENDGKIIVNNGIKHINTEERNIVSVVCCDGTSLSADYYISAIHPCSMLKLMDEHALPKAYRTRLNTIPNSYSAFSLYIKLKNNSFRYINHSEYYMTKYNDIWHFDKVEYQWPLGFLFMTPPEDNQGEYSTKALVTAPMPFNMVKKWEDTSVGKRGEDYKQWKDKCAASLLKMIDDIHPGFSECIENICTSSPLTIRDFYNTKEGGLSGYSKDCHNMALSQLPVVTKIKNLYLTGQNNNLHGFCGVPLTAINTCEAILGLNYVIDKINLVKQR